MVPAQALRISSARCAKNVPGDLNTMRRRTAKIFLKYCINLISCHGINSRSTDFSRFRHLDSDETNLRPFPNFLRMKSAHKIKRRSVPG